MEGMPVNIPVSEPLQSDIINGKSVKSLGANYLKNHWRVIVLCSIIGIVVGVGIVYAVKTSAENKKRKLKK